MAKNEAWAVRAERLLQEAQAKGSTGEHILRRLGWEDWETLLPKLVDFAAGEIRRRRWRGQRRGVLPEGADANSVAAEAIQGLLRGRGRLTAGWTRERLMAELKRKVSNEVRRLHKLTETRVVRNEWDVLPAGAGGELRSVFAGMTGRSMGGWDDGQVRDRVRKETELRIVGALREGNEARLFGCLRAGVVKRREIASRLGLSVVKVTNCRKRLNRKLDELQQSGCAGWAIEEWKKK